jgi:hypothetical protein
MLKPEKTQLALLVAILFMACLSTCNSCSTSKKVTKLKAEVDSLQTQLTRVPTREDTKKYLRVEGLRSSKRTLYDWNAVVRTAVRPDDRMNEYDQEIKKLEE